MGLVQVTCIYVLYIEGIILLTKKKEEDLTKSSKMM